MAQPPPSSLDAFDLAILDLMQQDNTLSQREIARIVNLSAPAIQRRVQRLRDSGVIQAEVAVLNADRVGRPLTMTVAVRVHDEHPQRTEGLRKRIIAEAAVQQCYVITGEDDFLLIITSASMAEFEAITRRLFEGDDNVKRFQTSVAMKWLKLGLHVPLPGQASVPSA